MLKSELKTFCHWPWSKIKVTPTGSITNCCFQRPIGNILDQPFEKWWHGQTLREVRQGVRLKQLSEPCNTLTCPYQTRAAKDKCQFCIRDSRQPTIVELDLPNTGCNIGGKNPSPDTACIMCPRAVPSFKPDGARFDEVVAKIRPFMPKLTELWLVGLAESFWQNQWANVLTKLDFWQYRDSCKYQTFSNGIVLDGTCRSAFLSRVPLSHVVVSLDAATPETYRRIRRLDVFERVVKNVRDYLHDPRRTAQQVIGVTYNINLLNIHEVAEMVGMWREEPLVCVCFTSTYPTGSQALLPYLVGQTNVQQFIKASEIIKETAAKLGMNNVDIFNPLEMVYGAKI